MNEKYPGLSEFRIGTYLPEGDKEYRYEIGYAGKEPIARGRICQETANNALTWLQGSIDLQLVKPGIEIRLYDQDGNALSKAVAQRALGGDFYGGWKEVSDLSRKELVFER